MCGIVGVAGNVQAGPILLDGVSRMEYRGYDSAGIAVVNEKNEIQVKKCKGRIQALSDMTNEGKDFVGTIGIGHTRWATHGIPDDINAHPHLSMTGNFALVHNGIIENYMELRNILKAKGVKFVSETDTEVIVQLLDTFYQDEPNILKALVRVTESIKGTYALGIVSKHAPGKLFAARKDSPLIIGLGEDSNYIASDVTAIIKNTRNVCYMNNDEIAVLDKDSVQLYDVDLNPVEIKVSQVNWDVSQAEKGGYSHFMLKEINEEPEAIAKTLLPRIKGDEIVLDDFSLTKEEIEGFSRIYIVACGSSYNLAMVNKIAWEQMMRRPVEVVLSSEFRYSNPIVDSKTLVILISQSGETLDTMIALRESNQRGARTLAIVNVVGSSIARESDDVLYTWAGPEIAVATTKGYSTQLALMQLLGLYMARQLGTIDDAFYLDMLNEMKALPDKLKIVLDHAEDVKSIASKFYDHNAAFFIGRNLDYAVCLEASLKLKELSYIHSEAYAAGELKHGTIALIEEGTLVVALGTYRDLIEKSVSNVVEVQSRGAEVVALVVDADKEEMAKVADHVLTIPETHVFLQPSLAIMPMQLLAFYISYLRGCDIDKPRNLAKSVTVE